MTDHHGPDRRGPVYAGLCDGCPTRRPQPVRDVAGEWGTATVCPWHEDHTE